MPLRIENTVVAALVIEAVDHTAHSERHRRIAECIGPRIVGAYANSHRFTNAERQARKNGALADIGRQVAGLRDKGIETPTRNLIPFDRLTISLLDRDAGTGTDAYVSGAPVTGWADGRTFDIQGTPVESVKESRSPLVVNADSPAELANKLPIEAPGTASGYRSLMAVPLVSNDRVIGVVTFRSTVSSAYTKRHEELAELFASHIVGPVGNSEVFTRVLRSSEVDTALADS